MILSAQAIRARRQGNKPPPELVARLVATLELSAALARLFLAGVTMGERAVKRGAGQAAR